MTPFHIDGPRAIQFSGGRTSARMLWGHLDAHDGQLPADTVVLFENTGKEREETLVFVDECSRRWSVPIVWLEWLPPLRPDGSLAVRPLPTGETFTKAARVGPLFGSVTVPVLGHRRAAREEYVRRCRVVDVGTASRRGEPFESLIEWAGMLPNPTAKICTQHLKIETAWAYLENVLGWGERTVSVGIRADEPKRFGSLGQDDRNDREFKRAPLAEAGIDEPDVMEFWARQPFDLQLQQHEGNCDLCPWKSMGKRKRIMRDRPESVPWWIAQEERPVPLGRKPSAMRFKVDEPTVRQIQARAEREARQGILAVDDFDDTIPCGCAG